MGYFCLRASLVLIWLAGSFSEVTSLIFKIYNQVYFHYISVLPHKFAAFLSLEEQSASQNRPLAISISVEHAFLINQHEEESNLEVKGKGFHKNRLL